MPKKGTPRKKVDLSTRAARRSLAVGVKYAVRLAKGRALLYRRTRRGVPGAWTVKFRDPDARTSSGYVFALLGAADDDGDGTGLSYDEAFDRARRWSPEDRRRPGADGDGGGPITVARACERYLEWYRQHKPRGVRAAEATIRTHVVGALGALPVEELTADRLRAWHEKIANSPALLRGPAGGGRKRKKRAATTDDAKRARRATANRVLGVLKAALNRAWEDGLVASRDAWARVKPFKGAGAARVGYLERDDLRRLLNGIDDPAFRRLVLAAIHTGCRYSELAALRADSFRPEAGEHGAVHVAVSKSGRSRFVFLGPEGRAFFDDVAAGKRPTDLLLTRGDGRGWRASEQSRPMAAAVASAGLPRTNFHALRHTYASLYLMSGGSLVALAKQLGHTTTRMVEAHYGHLSDAWRAAEAAKHAPALNVDVAADVKPTDRATVAPIRRATKRR